MREATPDGFRIETPSLLIRRFTLADAPAVFRLSQEESYRVWLPSQVYADRAVADHALEFLIGRYSEPGDPRLGPYVLAIEHRGDRALIGHVGFSPLDGEVEIGFAIAAAYQRRGLAAEAVVAASRWAIQTFALNRILAIAAATNTGSKRALRRAGFAFEEDRDMLFQGSMQGVSRFSLARDSSPRDGIARVAS